MISVAADDVEALSLAGLLVRASTSWPDRPACIFPDGTTTYAQLWLDACEIGARLRSLGVAPGDHVGILIPNSARFLATLFGIAAYGALPVPLNPRFRGDELPYVIEHADLVALVTTGEVATNKTGERIDYLERLANAIPELSQSTSPVTAVTPKLRAVAAFGAARAPWAVAWSDPGDRSQPADDVMPDWFAPVDPAGPSLMLYTSGSTSRPKGVLISAHALVSGAVGSMIDRLGTGHDDVVWSPLPMCHIGAFVAIVASFVVGAPFLSASHFDPEETVALLVRERATIAYAGMSMFYYDIARVLHAGNTSLPDLRLLTTASNEAEIERVRAVLPGVLQVSITGSTELSGSICTSDPHDSAEQRAATAGRPIKGVELSIRDEAGVSVSEGVVGELWVRGSCLLLGYYKDPGPLLTSAPDAGWFRTGDLAALVEGRLSFRGRLKDMIRVGGENVAAAEVENYLLRHPDIVSVAVVAAPDDRLGEVPAAFVELSEGSRLTIDEILAFCRVGLASFKVPRVVRLVDEWPMSATKIDKQRLRQQAFA
jgi:fatty-acyl-CoA synthase